MNNDDLILMHSAHAPRCRATVDKHFDGYYSLQYMTEGGVEIFYDQERVCMVGGVWMWPAMPGPHIRFHLAPGHMFWNHRFIAFKGPLVHDWLAADLMPTRPRPVHGAQTITPLFDALLASRKRVDLLGLLRSINLLERILIEIADERGGEPGQHAWMNRVIQLMEAKNRGWPDYEALARAAGMGVSTLRRKFRQATGLSLHQHAIQSRIARACGLLGASDLKVAEIAEELGYQDIYFFSRQFKQVCGVTPTAYRKSSLG